MTNSEYDLGATDSTVETTVALWDRESLVERLWQGDSSLWTGKDEARWTGWLHLTGSGRVDVEALEEFAAGVSMDGFENALLLGMGGSSLTAEVLARTFRPGLDAPTFQILDSTVPAQIHRTVSGLNLDRTLFIVASKSGSTAESKSLCDYFLSVLGSEAGHQFVAITDPGSALEDQAKEAGFRAVFPGIPEVGGRFSALSNFGLLPAALMGIDLTDFVDRADRMAILCKVPEVMDNPGVCLGLSLGELARAGRDKVTLVLSPGVSSFGAWLEQLLAESTGKGGRGLVPVAGEPPMESYSPDRAFVYIRLEDDADPDQDRHVESIAADGHPVIRIDLAEPMDLGAEFFRWEVATATAGALLGIHPFDQPNVQESKDLTTTLTDWFEKEHSFLSESLIFDTAGIQVFAEGRHAKSLGSPKNLGSCLERHLNSSQTGDYVALCCFLDMNEAHEELLGEIRKCIGQGWCVPTTVGFGPRYLHSTGQLHKGGGDNGLFIQITAEEAEDLPIPGRELSFSTFKEAQAAGDLLALSRRDRRAIRLHLEKDTSAGLTVIRDALREIAADDSRQGTCSTR